MSDIDLDSGTINIYHSKGFKDRIVYMSNSTMELCSNFNRIYSKILPNREYFFQPSYSKKHLKNVDICGMFDLILKKCAFKNEFSKKPSTHGLRHLFAVKSMKKSLSLGYDFDNWIKYLCKYMGHKTTQETMYYLHMVSHILPEYSDKMKNFTEGIGVIYEEY